MRPIRLAALLTTTLLFSACGGEEPAPQAPPPLPPVSSATASVAPPAPLADITPPPAPKPALADLIPKTLEGIGSAFNAHDSAKVASYYTEDCVVIGYGAPSANGRGEVAKSMQSLFDTFGEAKTAATRVWIKGNVVIAEFVWSGTMTGEFMGVKPSKKAAGQTRVHVQWFSDDGLLKEVHQYADGAGLMAQLEGKPGAPAVPLLPANGPDVHIAKGTPGEDKLADWGKGIDDGMSKDDPKAAAELMADDGDDWISFARMSALKGKREVAKGLDAWFRAVPDQKWVASNSWGIDGYAIVESVVTGTQKGRLGPIPPSDKPLAGWHWLDISQPNADGKVLHHWGYANLIELMKESGMKGPKKAPSKAPASH